MTQHIGACSWSLQPSSATDLASRLQEIGVSAVQLALDPIRTGAWDEAETVQVLRDAGISIVSGMMEMAGEDYTTLESIELTGGVRPDEHWEANLAAAHANASIAARLEIPLVTFHAGFLPKDASDPERATMLSRMAEIEAAFTSQGIRVALETGQETAATLLDALAEMESNLLGVNFDPANMILYGKGDPVESLKSLSPHVLQIHIKDATATDSPGTWGAEVRAGTGDVDWAAFFEAIRSEELDVDMMIEREAGDARVADMIAAREMVERERSKS